jgi:hypothetical protein
MSSGKRRLPLVWWCAGIYLAYLGLAYAGLYSGTRLGYLYFAWPYTAMLAVQKFINPGGPASDLIVVAVGATAILSSAYFLRGQVEKENPAALAVSACLICGCCMAAIALGLQYVAISLRWPNGE